MKTRPLQEISKVLAGMTLADLISIVWLSSQHLLPAHFMGLDFGQQMVVPAVVFDLALFIIFVHYGWHVGKIPRPRERAYLLIVGIVFAVVAVAHLLRLFSSGSLVLMGWAVPLWLSWIGVLVTAYLSYTSFILAARAQGRR